MTDFRALCEELANRMDSETGYTRPDGTRWSHPAVVRARAALAKTKLQPVAEEFSVAEPAALAEQPVGPTRGEAVAVYTEVMAAHDCQTLGDMAEHFARAVLARWGSHLTPTPVAERLPGPEDCDAEGQCWWWDTAAESWILALYAYWTDFTHWLPANALPVPTND
jgi:hypothetical protein